MKHLDKRNKWWRPWNIPVGKCSSEIYTNIHSHGGACEQWIQTAWGLPNTEWPEKGRKMQRLTHKHITCLWYAIIKCQQQIGFLTFTKNQGMKEWQALCSPPVHFHADLQLPCSESPGPVQAAAIPNGKAASQNDQRVPKEEKQQQIHSHGCSKMDFNLGL